MNKAYKEMKLSEQKKRDMIHTIKHGKPLKRKSYVGIVAPLFVVGILLFLMVSGSSTGNEQNSVKTGAGFNLVEFTQKAYFSDFLILWSVSLLFLMIAYVQFILLVMKPERLLENRLFRTAHAMMGTWRMIGIGAFPFVWIALETVIMLFTSSRLVAELFVVLLSLIHI